MKVKSALLYAGAAWQIVRFALLVLFMLLVIFPESAPGFVLLVVWPAVAQLPLAMAFFFLAREAGRYANYRNLLLLGKSIDAALGVLLVGLHLFSGRGQPLFSMVPALDLITGATIRSAFIFYNTLVAVVLFDLLFLSVLVFSPKSPEVAGTKATSNLPEFSEVRLEDE